MADTPDTLIFVHRERLTDGSFVYNVQLGEFVWKAVTESDAGQLAEAISDAINAHTNDTADVVYE